MKKVTLFGLLLLLFIMAACQTDAPAVSDPSAPTDRLVVYSGRSESLIQPLIDQFMADTGIQVDVRYGSTAEIAATILEEGANSPADIFFAQDPGGLGAVQAAGLLKTLPDDTLTQVADRFASTDGQWVGVSGRARVAVYNTNEISDPATQLPDDLWGFTEPEWNGRIGWAPTNGSFQAMVTGMRAVWGEEQTADWLRGIQANNPIAYQNNTAIISAVGSGEVTVGFVNHYYLYRFLAEEGESFPARNYFLPSGGPGSLIMISGVGILQTAVNSQNAQTFVDYLLAESAQQYFASETYEYPVITGIAIDPLLPPLAELEQSANNELSLNDLSDLAGTAQMLSDLNILP